METFTRRFEKEWIPDGSNIAFYITNLKNDFDALRKYYAKYFNENSTKDIEEYFTEFYVNCSKIYDIIIDPTKPVGPRKTDTSKLHDIFYFTEKQLKIDVAYSNKFGNLFLTDEAYNLIKPYVLNLFLIEDECSTIVKQIWEKSVTDIKKFNINKPYMLIVKNIACGNWRDISEYDVTKIEYAQKRIGTSASLVTNEKSKFFATGDNRCTYGYVYDIQDGFIAGSCCDAYLEEVVDNKNEFAFGEFDREKDNNLSRVHDCGKNELYSPRATKIATPHSVIDIKSYDYNEVILDSTKITPCAVFYVDKFMGGKKFNNNAYPFTKDRARELAKEKNLPLIALNDFANAKAGKDEEEDDDLHTCVLLD